MAGDKLKATLAEVRELLNRHRLVESLVQKQNLPKATLVESLVHRQNLVELEQKINRIHTADLAYILEVVPPQERMSLWQIVSPTRGGEILLEVSETVRPTLISALDDDELYKILESMDGDDISFLTDDLPEHVLKRRLETLTESDQLWLKSALNYDEDAVGYHMSNEMLVFQADMTIAEIPAYLNNLSEIPPHNDKAFVVDKRGALKGILKLHDALRAQPTDVVDSLMATDVISFQPNESVQYAANAFERYDLFSVPVVNDRNKLIGRLTVDAVMDFIREDTNEEVLNMAGLSGEEDIYAPIWSSAKNRGFWLLVNLAAAFVASRVIGAFEATIAQLVALASLMPIVASIGGNTGNQTTALIIRGLAQGQITRHNFSYLLRKEVSISAVNGTFMGATVGVFAQILYGNPQLSLVIATAMLFTLLCAGLIGLFVPIALNKLGKDPALGSSVIQTATTDNIGFLIFLGLATAYLI